MVRPARPGRYPTLFEYSGYFPGRNPTATYVNRFVAGRGHYAYVGVNLRGTGCSGGTFDFFEPKQAEDGAAVIAWIRRQGWSDGKVGMVRIAFGGMAATPRRAVKAEAALQGKTLEEAMEVKLEDYAPISDMRASATYRLETAQALLTKALLELQGETQTRVLVA